MLKSLKLISFEFLKYFSDSFLRIRLEERESRFKEASWKLLLFTNFFIEFSVPYVVLYFPQ